MDINLERDGGVIGTLFQQIINDMKVSEHTNKLSNVDFFLHYLNKNKSIKKSFNWAQLYQKLNEKLNTLEKVERKEEGGPNGGNEMNFSKIDIMTEF